MKLTAKQKAITASWIGVTIAIFLTFFVNEYVGYAVGFISVTFLRIPYVNDAKSFVQFTKVKPKIAYGLGGLAALSSVWLVIESIRLDAVNPQITENLFVSRFMCIPLGFWILLIVAHEVWLFPTLTSQSPE